MTWREECRQCGKTPMKGRGWCRDCLMRMRQSGVTDSVDLITDDEARRIGAPGPADAFVMPGKGRR